MIYLKQSCTKFINVFKMNKIIVSIVIAIVLILGINKITDSVYYVEKPEKSAYQVDGVATTKTVTSSGASAENSEAGDIMALFASTNSSEGEKIFKKCAACHSISQDGGNKIGPALWGVLGRKAGSVSDYKYSKALAAYGKPWSFEEMNGFLIKPKDWIKGTKMSFAGLKKPKDRAAVILYMNENTAKPLPLN
jgi:cytochrome c